MPRKRPETPEELQALRDRDRDRKRRKRQSESQDQRDTRLEIQRVINARTWNAMSDVRRSERTRAIGVSNARRESNEEPPVRALRLERMRFYSRMSRQRLNEARGIAIRPFTEDEVPEHYCGVMNVICEDCLSTNFEGERPTDGKFNSCCHKGKVRLPALTQYPELLEELMSGSHEHSSNFKDHIRQYNSALGFSSMGAQVDQIAGRGPYCYKIHGQIYHRTSTLHPSVGKARKFAQIYILDSNSALEQRMSMLENTGCLEELMNDLANVLHEVNPYAAAYKMMRDFEQEEIDRAAREGRPVKDIRMWIHQDKLKDKRRYNAPASNEVAIVFRSDDGEPPYDRDICVHPKDAPMQNISFLSQHCDPMTYPLLFPRGEKGWVKDTKLHGGGKRQHVTHLQHYSYYLATRNEFNPILSAGKLFQQFVVDAYCKIEANRLNFHKQNQDKLRSDLYSGLMDHVNNFAANEGTKPGTICILPSSFGGSERCMQQNFQDAMAIVRKYGKPDLFCTFTCNPKWKEIEENLRPGETASDRPDLVSRVMKLKLKEFLSDILVKKVFGLAIAHVYVIEFQKRGLPHCHILIILANEDKPRTVDDIDKIVCAEIPDPVTNPRLHEIVKANMVHGPCGKLNMKCVCMAENECTKGFPKPFQAGTQNNVDGYPVYRRRNDGTTIKVGKYTVDNTWIVPYNKYLSLKFNAHINLEICTSIKSVKYIFKYVYKGHDRANLKFQAQTGDLSWDEPAMYVDSRYISAPEGMWRIREHKMHEQSHTIIRLAVHLPDQQRVVFQEGNEIGAAVRAAERYTTLTAWFELNRSDTNARQYLYQDIPSHYVFDSPKNKNKWSPRQRGHDHVISRMYSVSPSDAERYFLRLLLLHVRGAMSFDDIKTVDGIVCSTFREAARLRNLLRDDTEWDRCLSEALLFQLPGQLRELFGVTCAFCNPSDPLTLWNTHKDSLIEDFIREHSPAISEQMALDKIQEVLALHNKSCIELGLPHIPSTSSINEPEIDREEESRVGKELYDKLNKEQQNAFNEIMNAIENPVATEHCFFLDGPGGSGKSFTFNALIRTLRGKGIQFKSVALTGIAAELLIEGRTVHSTFGVPLKIVENSTSSVTAKSFKGRALIEAKLIIWDECTMASKHLLTLVDRLLRDLMNKPNTPFGGKVMLLGGHFCQTLPVVKRGNRASIVGASLKSSPLWRRFKRLQLTKNMRADADEREFAEWCLKLGNGEKLNTDNFSEDIVQIPSKFIADGDIIDEVYGKIIKLDQVESLSQRAILCPKNKDTMTLNEAVLKRLEGIMRTYLSVDEITVTNDGDEINYPVEFLNSVTPSGLPPHELNLKEGAVVMLLRNLNTKKGLCNGTRLIVTKMHAHVIEAKIVTGNHAGEVTFIPRIGLDTMDDSDLPFDMYRRQFPVRLAYAITINKAQGQTLEMVGIFLPEPVFSHGQLYVAFSRGKGYSKVRVKICPSSAQGKLLPGSNKVFTQNIVYKEVLDHDEDVEDNDEYIWEDLDIEDLDLETAQNFTSYDAGGFNWSTIDLDGIDSEGDDDLNWDDIMRAEIEHSRNAQGGTGVTPIQMSTSRGDPLRYEPPPPHNYYADSDSE